MSHCLSRRYEHPDISYLTDGMGRTNTASEKTTSLITSAQNDRFRTAVHTAVGQVASLLGSGPTPPHITAGFTAVAGALLQRLVRYITA